MKVWNSVLPEGFDWVKSERLWLQCFGSNTKLVFCGVYLRTNKPTSTVYYKNNQGVKPMWENSYFLSTFHPTFTIHLLNRLDRTGCSHFFLQVSKNFD